MLIKIIGLLLLFLVIVYLYKKKEGLTNQYNPISIRRSDADYIVRKMTTDNDLLYDVKFRTMKEADIVRDMSYFNNATAILYTIGKYG